MPASTSRLERVLDSIRKLITVEVPRGKLSFLGDQTDLLCRQLFLQWPTGRDQAMLQGVGQNEHKENTLQHPAHHITTVTDPISGETSQ